MDKRQKEAAHRIQRARSILIVTQPFYGCLALHLKVKCIDELDFICNTMATDGIHLFYNTEFVLGITEEELVGVNAHEVTHCAYKHMVRIKDRDKHIANIAMDFIINKDITDAGFKLPGEPRTLDELLEGQVGYCYDRQFDNMSFEEAYEVVRKRMKDQKKLPKQGQGGGKGSGKIIITDTGGCGAVMSPEDTNIQEGTGTTMPAMDRKWDVIARQAIGVERRKNAGTIPGHLKRLVDELEAPNIIWEDLLRRFIDSTAKRDYDWTRPNKKYMSMDMYLPSHQSESINHLVIAVDNSGSVDNDLLKRFASEINASIQEGIADEVTVIYADTRVNHIEKYQAGEEFKMDAEGGGGTDFADTFKWINKHIIDPSVVIYFTDMYVHSHGEDPGVPVMWAAYNREGEMDTLQEQVPFGEVICLH